MIYCEKAFKKTLLMLNRIARVLIVLFALYTSFALFVAAVGYEDMIRINQGNCMAAERAAFFVKEFIDKNRRIPSVNELKGAPDFAGYDLVLYREVKCMDSRCRLNTILPPPSYVAFPYVIMDNSEVPLIWTLWSNKCNRAQSPSEIYLLGGREEEIALEIFLIGLCFIAYTYLRRVSNSNGK